MSEETGCQPHRSATLLALLVSIAVFATIYTLVLPLFEGRDLNKRMKAVSSEREQMRLRERARMNSETSRASLRTQNNTSAMQIVERFNLRKALVDDNTVNRLKAAGLRTQNALNVFLVARFLLPFVFLAVVGFWIFGLGNMADRPFACACSWRLLPPMSAFMLPTSLFSNRISKRQASIKRAWPDALDLMLICGGVGHFAGSRHASRSRRNCQQSAPLAEEMVLTTAELSFLPDRRVCAGEPRRPHTA